MSKRSQDVRRGGAGKRSGSGNERDFDPVPVSARWLLKAMLAMLAVAAGALYLTVCLLFYQGQWQFVFAPKRLSGDAAAVARAGGLPVQDVRFDFNEEGLAQLDGWWIPAETNAAQKNSLPARVVLYFSDGRSGLRENADRLLALHAMGAAVFSFDYRGFGMSAPGHPSQQRVYEDGAAALRYLTETRHVDPQRIVLYGAGVGAAVAAQVAQSLPGIGGVVLENPQPSQAEQVKREQHIHILPMRIVFPERFDIAGIVPQLKMPKLVIVSDAQSQNANGGMEIYREAVDPKEWLRVNGAAPLMAEPAWRQAVARFLNSAAASSRVMQSH